MSPVKRELTELGREQERLMAEESGQGNGAIIL